ncbi:MULTISPECIES: hypothetical protein [unclassified Caballeronia]|uniref:hypothetical protein n=1 Tax=unclassified Caballeronia TaxID=2646786 RepID=UPI00025BC715|nr:MULTISPECIES: hypothetical protein [unclassified Caballeronia]EKS70258.1 hypothetical protein BURK_019330 [Burkholderia sp. SJ98]MCE4546469.1 hypothetical protein [Caballeronia sp. PC1]MCE4573057.1 hypothetical protein [Caballeronia sp. CLC5]
MKPTWIVRLFAVVMPWLFLGLKRSMIPSTSCVVLAVFFYAVPQSREVLHGLIEADFNTHQEVHRSLLSIVNATALLSYFLTSILLALSIWYSARLLCTVQFRLISPAAWTRPGGRYAGRQIRYAVTWLPRALGVASLAASMGALIFANYVHLNHYPGRVVIAIVGLGLIAPMLVAAVTLKRFLDGPSSWQVYAVTPAVLLYLVSVICFAAADGPRKVFVVSVIAALLPACLLAVLVLRRVAINGRGKGTLVKTRDVPLRRVLGRVGVLTLAGFIALGFLALSPSGIARSIGSASAIIGSLAALVMFLTGLQLALSWATQCVPGFTTAVVLLLIVPIGMVAKRNIGREAFEQQALRRMPHESTRGPASEVPVWGSKATAAGRESNGKSLDARDNPRVFPSLPLRQAAIEIHPRLYITASGGGVRAAIFTAQLLALADDASCGMFGEHIAATSSVSGGSLGIAAYLVTRQELVQHAWQTNRKMWDHCTPGAMPTETPLLDAVNRALVQDHLSATIVRGVTLDLVPFVKPGRGMALLDSWNDALKVSIVQSDLYRQEKEPTIARAILPFFKDDKPEALNMPLRDLTGSMQIQPTVYFNATDSEHGGIVWFSNKVADMPDCEYGSVPNAYKDDPTLCGALTVGQAVLHSARFPLITPPGAFPAEEELAVLVDGGYADDSGGQTLRYQVGEDKLRDSDSRLLEIDGNPPEHGKFCGLSSHESVIPVAVEALLLSRSARASLASQQLIDIVPPCSADAQNSGRCSLQATLDLEQVFKVTKHDKTQCARVHQAQVPPLGWYTGSRAAALIMKSVTMQVPSICRLVNLECRNPPRLDLNEDGDSDEPALPVPVVSVKPPVPIDPN